MIGENRNIKAKRFDAARDLLDLPIAMDPRVARIELEPLQPPAGYPWHAYYGARFAWRDERAALLRGVNGTGFLTSHNRPETPDYLELRLGRQSTVLLTGGAEVKGTRTQTVTAVGDKELTLKTVTEVLGKEVPSKRPSLRSTVTPA